AKLADIGEGKAVDVLLRGNRLDDGAGVDVARQRQLDENAVDRAVGVELVDQLDQLGLRGLSWQRVLDGLEAAFLCLLGLRGDVDLASRILANDDDGQTGRDTLCRQLLRGFLHRRHDVFGDFLTVDNFGHFSSRSLRMRLPPRGEDGAGYSTLRREQRALLRRGFFTLRQEEISRAEAAMLRIVYRSLVGEILDGFAEFAQAAADLVDRRVGALVDIGVLVGPPRLVGRLRMLRRIGRDVLGHGVD